MTAICRVCKERIVVPHCESVKCGWCKACVTRKNDESQAQK